MHSLIPQLPKSEIFAEVFVCGAHKKRVKIEDFWSWGIKELESCGVTELRSSDLHILNGVHSSLVTMGVKMCIPFLSIR